MGESRVTSGKVVYFLRVKKAVSFLVFSEVWSNPSISHAMYFFPLASLPAVPFWTKTPTVGLDAPRGVMRGWFLWTQSNTSPAAPDSSSSVYPWVSLWACTNVFLCSISCSACDRGLFGNRSSLFMGHGDEWIYTYLVRYPHTGSPASQPWGVKIDMAFPKESEILWLCPCPLPPVLVSSTCQLWCPSVLFIYVCMETAVVFYGVWSCLLSSLPTDCCS